MFVNGLANPLDCWITADSFVEGIHQDYLKELVGRVLAHPVGVQDTESTTFATNTLLGIENKSIYKFIVTNYKAGDTLS